MAISDDSPNLNLSRPRQMGGILKLLANHQGKTLNVALIIYLCLGATVFEWLEKFDKRVESRRVRSMAELRLSSARKMWNITNQLNILYESNWTSLMLDELAQFERLLVEALSSVSQPQAVWRVADEQQDSAETSSKQREIRQEKAIKSWRKSFVHALATVTTMDSPSGTPNSSEAKLATVIYGILGIPLLVLTLSESGKQLAELSLDKLSLMKHYYFSTSVHHLRCGLQLGRCKGFGSTGHFCGHLCCLPASKRRSSCADQCDRRRAPNSEANQQDGASSFGGEPNSNEHVIGDVVRAEAQKEPKCNGRNAKHNQSQSSRKDSMALFVTSLALLAAYLTIGAYAFARRRGIKLIDALFAYYSMLSMTKLSCAFGRAATNLSPAEAHQTLLRLHHETEDTLDTFALDLLYLLLALHIISMSIHLAKLWLSAYSSSYRLISSQASSCKGHLTGAVDEQVDPTCPLYSLANSSRQPNSAPFAASGSRDTRVALSSHLTPQLPSFGTHKLNLSELYVVNDETSPVNMHEAHQQHNSDVSFASDGSIIATPICVHYQVAPQVPCQGPQLYGFTDQVEQGYQIYLPASAQSILKRPIEDEGECDDEVEAEQLAHYCMMQNGAHSHHSSSSNSRPNQRGQELTNGYELDNSLTTTNSNTVSSSLSSNTVKLPQLDCGLNKRPFGFVVLPSVGDKIHSIS